MITEIWFLPLGVVSLFGFCNWGGPVFTTDFDRSLLSTQEFSEGKPEVLQPRVYLLKILREPSHCPAAQCRHPRDSPEGTVFQHCPEDFQQLLRGLLAGGLNKAKQRQLISLILSYSTV